MSDWVKTVLLLGAFFVLLGVIGFVAVLVVQWDDALSEEVLQLKQRVDRPAVSEPYLHHLGMQASAAEDPIAVGQQLLEEYRRFDQDQNYEVVEYPKAKHLTIPEEDIFCAVSKDEACLKTLFYESFDITAIRQQHKVLLERVAKFHRFNDYKTLSKPTLKEVFPRYRYLVIGENIANLTAIAEFKRGNAGSAITQLRQQLQQLRFALTKQDTFIGKVIFLLLLSEKVDVLSVVLSLTPSALPVAPIDSLSVAEKSLRSVIAREFMTSYYAYIEIGEAPEMVWRGGSFPGWVLRLFFKQNMSINALAPLYYRMERLALLTPRQFAIEVMQPVAAPKTSSIRNFSGNIFLSIAVEPGSSFDGYIGRLIDFEAKITLFNHRYHLQQDITNAKNPYFADETPQIKDNKACFRGPLEDKVSMRCLPLSLPASE